MSAGTGCRLESPSGLRIEVNADGSLRRIDHGDVLVNLFLGSALEGGPANLYLRRLGPSLAWIPLLGARSPGAVHLDADGLVVRGAWGDLHFTVALVLACAAPAWFWHVAIENRGAAADVDLVYAQDLGLAHYGATRMNEYYVSQYVDYTPLADGAHGTVLAVRQNQSMGGRHPWIAVGSLARGVGFGTDALQLYGAATRADGLPDSLLAPRLPGRRQHEHSMAVVQDTAVRLDAGGRVDRGFFAWLEADHPAASSVADLAIVAQALALPEAVPPEASAARGPGVRPVATLFGERPTLATLDLEDGEIERLYPGERRHVERAGATTLSFFADANRHVVLRAKELGVLRPHGAILRSGDHLTPDEASLTSTVWMNGVFHSLVTQGHVGINRFLSTTRSYLGLLRAGGLRAFVELADGWHLLGLPSAFEMTPGSARWLYRHAGGLIEVRSWAATASHELGLAIAIREGAPCRLLLSHHLALGGDDGANPAPVRVTRDAGGIAVHVVPDTDVGRRFPAGFFRLDPHPETAIERVGGDELLFADERSQGEPFLTIVTAPAQTACFRITGGLVPSPQATAGIAEAPDRAAEDRFWTDATGALRLHAPQGSPLAPAAARVQDFAPWLAHDALVHYLAPRGLEQYSGGGWGTRDVSQGPVEMLLALGKWAPLRDLLLRIFRAQNPDGDWPQWFTFFERDRGIRADDSHGDIVFWPVLALAQYLAASEDAALLDEVVPFFHPEGDARAEQATVAAHVDRALAVMERRVIAGTALAAYGHGDWNDSLQPVDPSMRERLCSAWTVTLHCQTVTALAQALRSVGRDEHAPRLDATAARIRADFQRLLLPDGTLAGFAYFHPDERVDYLLHPRDARTGIHYRLLPMIHAILNDLLTPAQAQAHVAHIRAHLLGPDGARLFDRPPEYRGGPPELFQRAETATFFGREIGLMYMHAHLRFAEAMAHLGDADAFWLALAQANPIALRETVPQTALRQANCYYSSSDATFADRYEARARYHELRAGRVPIEGGWRIYSSGAGIALRLIHQCFLGLRVQRSALTLDPVLPRALDGLRTEVHLAGLRLRVTYRVAGKGAGPTAVTLGGRALPFEREPNPYRTGGATVSMAALRERLAAGDEDLVIRLA